MSTSADRAIALRAEADALDALGLLETELLAAKNSGDLEAVRATSEALRQARSLTRTDGVSIGGDAYIETEA